MNVIVLTFENPVHREPLTVFGVYTSLEKAVQVARDTYRELPWDDELADELKRTNSVSLPLELDVWNDVDQDEYEYDNYDGKYLIVRLTALEVKS